MSWTNTRGAAGTLAKEMAHSDDAKHRAHDAHHVSATTRPSWGLVAGGIALVLAAVVAVVIVRNGSSDASPAAAPARTQEPTPTPSPSPTASATPVGSTAPTGVYSVTTRISKVVPANAPYHRKGIASLWTFKQQSCTGTTCTGTIVSNGGARYSYTWDGVGLQLSRAPFMDTVSCGDGTTRLTKHTYAVPPPTVTPGADGRPERISLNVQETLTLARDNGCHRRPIDLRFAQSTVTATRRT
jgi:hypothetical protein